MRLPTIILQEGVRTVRRPWRIFHLLNQRRRNLHLSFVRLSAKIGDLWSSDGAERGVRKRIYSGYEAYIAHQEDKLQRLDLSDYDKKYGRILRERLQTLDVVWEGRSVLCLAARIGTEVKSFLNLGCFAVGIDINPGENNRYVLHGDFHDIQFPKGAADVVFTNALDHVFDVHQVIREIKRVLKPKGLLIIEAVRGTEEGESPGFHESFYWSSIDDLALLFQNEGFRTLERSSFSYPWDGQQLCFVLDE